VKKKKKNYAGSKNHSPHWLRKRSHFGTEYRKAPPPRKGKEKSMRIRRVAGLA
jgi:regulator of sigma D